MITLREAVAGLCQGPEETWANLPIVKKGLMELAAELLEYECGITVISHKRSHQARSRRVSLVIAFGCKWKRRTVIIDGYALSDEYGVMNSVDYFMYLGPRYGGSVIGDLACIKTKLGAFMAEQGLAVPRRSHLFYQLWFEPKVKEIVL